MLALPPVTPSIGWRNRVRLPRDHYVRIDTNDYSVDPAMVGRTVEVVADLNTVAVTCAGKIVASHQRCWAKHQSITDPAHHQTALQLAYQAAHRPTPAAPESDQVQQRDLGAYDTAFGLTEEVA